MKTSANDIRKMIANAEANGGSVTEIESAIKQWDPKAESIEIAGSEISVDGKFLADEEIETWFWWTQGVNRKGEETRIR